jgi:hypothetical protein
LKPSRDLGLPREPERADAPEQPTAAEPAASPWEMIETGRYMPRRIRGSFPGRELG